MANPKKELKQINTFLKEQGMTEEKEEPRKPYFESIGDFDEDDDDKIDDSDLENEDDGNEEDE